MAMRQTRNSKNLLMHFKGYEDFISRILDLEEMAKRYQKIIFTPFYSEHERLIVKQVVKGCFLYEEGGYENSELKRMAITMYEEEDIVFPIVALTDTFDGKYHQVTHRDVLGALMNLGIERKVVGDIIVQDGRIVIYAEQEIADYLIQHLTQVKRVPITLSHYQGEIVFVPQLDYYECVVSSFRADALVAAIAHLSREKAKQLIRSGKVKVNQVVLEDYDYLCNNNSTVSIRGYGKFVIEDLNRKTRKQHFLIRIGKYL